MVTLKQYLGSIITSIKQGRMLADIESASIAHLYAENPLLRAFPIPRFRASEVELRIPVAIDHLEEVMEDDYQPFNKEEFMKLTFEEINRITQTEGHEEAFANAIKKNIEIQVDLLEKSLQEGSSKERMLKLYTTSVSGQYISILSMQDEKKIERLIKLLEIDRENLQEGLAEKLKARLSSAIKEPNMVPDLYDCRVIVETAKLKEIRSDVLVNIKMTLYEEGMEWQIMQDEDGNKVSKLLPE